MDYKHDDFQEFPDDSDLKTATDRPIIVYEEEIGAFCADKITEEDEAFAESFKLGTFAPTIRSRRTLDALLRRRLPSLFCSTSLTVVRDA